MKTYEVLSELHHDGAVYLPGSVVELDDDAAQALLDVDVIAHSTRERDDPPSPDGGGRLAAIRGAIRTLPVSDPALWTKSGAPQVSAVEHVLGEDITAAERDAAWARVQREAAAGQEDRA